MRVLVVVTALRILDLGPSGVGFLNSADGVGGLAGVLVVLGMVTTARLSGVLALGLLLWGLPLVVLGVWPSVPLALLCFGVIGVGNILVDVAGLTLLQRTAPDKVRARVFGVWESVFLATIGLGAIIAPLLISAFGPQGALIAAGGGLAVVVLLLWRRLGTVDAPALVPERELTLLREIPIFAPLPPVTLEQLASHLSHVRLGAGDVVFRQGERGDRFYIVEHGEVEVEPEGREAVVLGRGGSFGEIALLRDVPRTATVTATTDVELWALERDIFIASVTGHAPSSEAADAVIATHLGAASAIHL
jgi:hypothetical protein